MSLASSDSPQNFPGHRTNVASTWSDKLGKIAPAGRGPKALVTCARNRAICCARSPRVARTFVDDSGDFIVVCGVVSFIIRKDGIPDRQILQGNFSIIFVYDDSCAAAATFVNLDVRAAIAAHFRRVRQHVQQLQRAAVERLLVVHVALPTRPDDGRRRDDGATLHVHQAVGESLAVLLQRGQIHGLVVALGVEAEQRRTPDPRGVVAADAIRVIPVSRAFHSKVVHRAALIECLGFHHRLDAGGGYDQSARPQTVRLDKLPTDRLDQMVRGAFKFMGTGHDQPNRKGDGLAYVRDHHHPVRRTHAPSQVRHRPYFIDFALRQHVPDIVRGRGATSTVIRLRTAGLTDDSGVCCLRS